MARREHKILHAVACPTCRAPRGQQCRLISEAEQATGQGRLLVHGERRAAWQRWRDTHPVDVYAQPDGSSEGGRAGWLTPRTEAGRIAVGSEHRVHVAELRPAIDRLAEQGLRVE